nr:peptidase domain-containing ABC transporter [uncultured Carboxylicivirga sp.]
MNLRRIKTTFNRQHDQRDCGIACLSSVVNLYGGSIKAEQLRLWSGTNHRGTTLLGLYQAAQKCGFEAEGCKADIEYIKKHDAPLILHITLPQNLQHYIIYYGSKKGKAIIGDPAKGIELLAYDELDKLWQSKTFLTLKPNNTFQLAKSSNKEKRLWFWQLIEEDMPILFASVVIGLLTALLGLSLAVFNQKLVDDIIPEGGADKMTIAVVLLCFLLIIKGGLKALRANVLLKQGRLFSVKIATRFFSKLLSLPKTFYDSRRSGDLVARLNDTSRIQVFVSRTLGSMTISGIVLFVSLVAILLYNQTVGLIAIAILPLYVIILIGMHKTIAKKQRRVLEHYAHSESFYLNTLQGIEPLQDFNRIDFFGDRNTVIYKRYQEQVYKLGSVSIKLGLIADLAGVVNLGTVLGYGVYQVYSGIIKTGELLAIITLVNSVVPTITSLLINFMSIQEARIAFDRMFEFIKVSDGEKREGSTADSILPLNVSKVSFRFPGRSLLLQNVELKVEKNQIVALLGESGCGKSTLINLIKGNYPVENGDIRFNNTLPDWDVLRQKISVVPQSIALFNESVLFNITLSQPTEVLLNQTHKQLSELGLLSYFEELPQGLLTQVGEEGINLSGGQKQVVAIARALIHQPELLILDEATSAMDRATEANILNLIQKLKKQMSVLFITHRVHVLAGLADRIYILDGTTIVDQGSPSELMLRENAYSDFWKQINIYA